jgi:DNA-binding ferritin-like protein
VVANGGPAEIIIENNTGFRYTTLHELVEKTRAALFDAERANSIRHRAILAAQQFSEASFMKRWRDCVANNKA